VWREGLGLAAQSKATGLGRGVGLRIHYRPKCALHESAGRQILTNKGMAGRAGVLIGEHDLPMLVDDGPEFRVLYPNLQFDDVVDGPTRCLGYTADIFEHGCALGFRTFGEGAMILVRNLAEDTAGGDEASFAAGIRDRVRMADSRNFNGGACGGH